MFHSGFHWIEISKWSMMKLLKCYFQKLLKMIDWIVSNQTCIVTIDWRIELKVGRLECRWRDWIVGLWFELLPAKQAECRDTPYIGLFTKLESNYIYTLFNHLHSGWKPSTCFIAIWIWMAGMNISER
jgi:hypothetical protein